ncbi:MAG: phosphoglycerate dehydrogenase [Bacillota bacterium]|jgi:D-3-phosphoglycerate dehydrogenase|nr:phosphoglycerate dehydrogenase [Bacillota bacterium]
MYRVLITDPLSDQGIKPLLEADGVEVDQRLGLTEDELIRVIPEYDALLVRSQTKVTAAVIDAAERLKVIGRAGVGVDNIDLLAATRKGIVVVNAPDGNTISTAEHTFAMLMALARHIPQACAALKAGTWDRKSFVGVELAGKTLGIVGLGRIGSEVAKRAKAFHMRVVAYDPYLTEERAAKLGVEMADLDTLFAEADFLTVHTPLTKETRHLIGRDAFRKMKDGVRILNCARGGIIDEAALYEAIRAGKVAGAALDVFEEEPPKDNPLVDLPQVIVTPHLGASTVEAQENVALDVCEEVLHILRGEPFKNAVNLPSIPAHVMKKVEPYYGLCEKLGRLVAHTLVGAPRTITVTYSGELTETDTSFLTRSVLKGVLSYHLGATVNFINAPHLARERDIRVTEQKSNQPSAFTNLITVEIASAQETRRASGTLLNGFGPRIVKIDGYSVDVAPEGHLILIRHYDRPGVIGRVGTVLGQHGINIATMQVSRRDVGGHAMMILTVDKPASPDVLDTLGELDEIRSVMEMEW